MKIAIVGAGIVGVTTAYELAADGHEVTVFERRGTAAEETSFANAGLVAPGYVTPWAAPGMPRKVPGTLAAKTRYRQADGACALTAIDASGFELAFSQAQWAATPGQSAVLYAGEVCLGGGVISA